MSTIYFKTRQDICKLCLQDISTFNSDSLYIVCHFHLSLRAIFFASITADRLVEIS